MEPEQSPWDKLERRVSSLESEKVSLRRVQDATGTLLQDIAKTQAVLTAKQETQDIVTESLRSDLAQVQSRMYELRDFIGTKLEEYSGQLNRHHEENLILMSKHQKEDADRKASEYRHQLLGVLSIIATIVGGFVVQYFTGGS